MLLPKRFAVASAALLLIALVIAVQAFSGAYVSDFSAGNDEAAHAVSSLLVHDYLAHGLPQNPLRYAEKFYVHYPKVAIGHWPPLFYAGEGVWMLAFGRTKVAMMAFVAALAIALLTSVFWWVRRDYGTGAALVSAVVLIGPPFMQLSIASAAPNIALALIAFWAAAMFGDYLDRRRLRDLVLFSILVAAAIGVHGRGVAVAFLPPALLFTGRFAWTRFRVLMLTAAILAAVLLPWLLRQAARPNIVDILHNAGFYLYRCGVSMSWPAVILAAAGAWMIIRRATGPRRSLAMPALALGAWMFHSLASAGWGDRYLVTAAPAIAALTGAGFHFFTRTRLAWIVLLCAGLAWSAFPLFRKPDLGYHRMATTPGTIHLIAGSSLQEGAFVSEMALRDHALNRIVLRGSKVLAMSTWMGNLYQLRFSTSAEVLAFLDQARVDTVLFELADREPHVPQLASALLSDSMHWREIHLEGQPAGISAFARASPLPPGDPVIRIDMRYNLRKTLELKPGER